MIEVAKICRTIGSDNFANVSEAFINFPDFAMKVAGNLQDEVVMALPGFNKEVLNENPSQQEGRGCDQD